VTSFDVIVVGGGHAGVEAANAASRAGARALLLTSNIETVGQMSCNPAIGGIAKGTVVREIDAMGGLMGRAADRATIQFRMLNLSKGPAVWAPRAQCDRGLYRRAIRSLLEEQSNLLVRQGTVATLMFSGNTVEGVNTTDGQSLFAPAVVLAAGTFLRGKMFVGLDGAIEGGRSGDPPANELADQLREAGLRVERFKTGTPPRVDGRTVDYERVEEQVGTMPEYRFSHFERTERPDQKSCWITWAGGEAKEIIERHINESALFGGVIGGRGPRYCPSIEDKVVRFPDAERHQVFLEPEGLHTTELYVNGLSTSLPAAVQLQFLQAVPGLERVRMTRCGYAIEYDYYPPEQLRASMELKSIEGLYLAGQVNGTTGYEEAGAQGLIAGLNATHRTQGLEPVTLSREQAYSGVLIDDLVTRGVDEPYRLFTSRAEFRLLLRQDNAIERLSEKAASWGVLGESEKKRAAGKVESTKKLMSVAERALARPSEINPILRDAGENGLSEPQRVCELVRRPGLSLRTLLEHTMEELPEVDDEAWTTAEIELKYSGYMKRERDSVRQLEDMAAFRLPDEIDYLEIASICTEAREKLNRIRPESLAQAGRIPGVSPSDLQNLVVEVTKLRRRQAT